jgi:cell division protein FtsW
MSLFSSFFGNSNKQYNLDKQPMYDRTLVVIVFLLLTIGLVIVYSASIEVATVKFHNEYHHIIRQFIHVVIGIVAMFIVANITVERINSLCLNWLLYGSIVLCIIVIFVGKDINGAKRWLSLGFFNFQPSELLKFVWIVYLSGYVSRHYSQLQSIVPFFKPFLLLLSILIVLYFQKDFGSIFLVCVFSFTIIFLCGGRFRYLISLFCLGVILLSPVVLFSSYRKGRILSFMEPFAPENIFGEAYQLCYSLMAYGQADIWGKGLGNSIVKMSYLPEPHTDFIISIWAEETGIIGVAVVIILEFMLIAKCTAMGLEALRCQYNKNILHGFIAIGTGVWFLCQTFINIGMSMALVPTKGLTLPFVSYGGSSLIIMLMAIGVLIRISFERRVAYKEVMLSNSKHNQQIKRKRVNGKELEGDKNTNAVSKKISKNNEEIEDRTTEDGLGFESSANKNCVDGHEKFNEDIDDNKIVNKSIDVKDDKQPLNKKAKKSTRILGLKKDRKAKLSKNIVNNKSTKFNEVDNDENKHSDEKKVNSLSEAISEDKEIIDFKFEK